MSIDLTDPAALPDLLTEADSVLSWMLNRSREKWPDENEINDLIGRLRRAARAEAERLRAPASDVEAVLILANRVAQIAWRNGQHECDECGPARLKRDDHAWQVAEAELQAAIRALAGTPAAAPAPDVEAVLDAVREAMKYAGTDTGDLRFQEARAMIRALAGTP